MIRARVKAAIALLAVVAAVLPATAQAELVAHGNLFVNFQGGLTPKALPRHALAPISVSIEGTVRTFSGENPPALRQMKVELNRHGVLDTEGLPVCPLEDIVSTSDVLAMKRCGTSLVGTGRFLANDSYPEQVRFPTTGRILAFNGLEGRRPVIFAHIYGTVPLTSTRIVVFRIERGSGAYGTVLTGALPAALNPFGFVENISLHLHRTYTYLGKDHSYISAGCPAPSGFSSAVFPFARASMSFSDGRSLQGTLVRSCRVKP